MAESAPGPRAAATGNQVTNALDKIPLSFEANHGQTDRSVRFMSRGQGYALFLTGDEAVLSLKASDQRNNSTSASRIAAFGNAPRNGDRCNVLRVRLQGADRNSAVTGIAQLPGKANYFIGRDPRHWTTNVPTYQEVKYANVYPGIDLVYHGSSQHQLEYDFVVGPGRDPSVIELAFAGADSVRLNQQGDLVIQLRDGEVIEQAPVIYQETDEGRRAISGGYQIKGKDVVFKLGTYDKRKSLIIDPTLAYSTFLGGSDDDFGTSIAVDSQGNAYVTGYTVSADFPTTPGVFQSTLRGGRSAGSGTATYDAFVTKLNRDGSQLVYSTFVGGDASDQASGIALDEQGNAYITGVTTSTNFPVTPNAYQPNFGATGVGFRHSFVTKLNNKGSGLIYSTFLGGSSSFDKTQAIAVDALGNAYISGNTGSADFPTTPGAPQSSFGGVADAFVTKLNASGSALVYSTFLGGTGQDSASAIVLDGQGSVYITGFTRSSNFPITPGAYQTSCRNCSNEGNPVVDDNAFVSKLSGGGQLVYSTFLGSNAEGKGIAVDGLGNAYVIGNTSPDFPTTPGAFVMTNPDGEAGAFVTKFNGGGSQLVYSIFLPTLFGQGIAVNRQGNAYFTGFTQYTAFPTTPDAFEPGHPVQPLSNRYETILARFNLDGSALDYSTNVGIPPSNNMRAQSSAIALDCCSNAYVTGTTNFPTFPVTPGAYQTTFGGGGNPNGGGDAFIYKFKFEPPIILTPTSGSTATGVVAIGTKRNTGVKWLNVYVDGTHLASSPPFTFSWDSSKFASGPHTISALSYGYDNLVNGTDQVTVQVNNPVVMIDQPAQNAKVSGTVTIATERTQGVSWLNVYIDGKHLASSPPFSFPWDSTKISNGGHTISIKGYAPGGTLLGSASVIVNVVN